MSRQLFVSSSVFAPHVVGSWPMKKKKKVIDLVCFEHPFRPYIIVKSSRPRVVDRHIQELVQGFR